MRAHRPHVLRIVLLASLVLAALPGAAAAQSPGCADANTRPGNASEASLSKATVCLINRERKRRGLRALRVNKRLSRAALSHTRDMIQRRYFAHESGSGLDVVDRLTSSGYLGRVRNWLVGENLAWGSGSRSTPREAVVGWMNSPGHRRNMLNRRFREIGIGVVFSAPNHTSPVAATYTTTFGTRR
jgi:uncharacterized protein YkwD